MRTSMIVLVGCLVTGFGGSANAAALTGKWQGRTPTSLEFLKDGKVKYCYRSKCTVQTYTGDPESQIKFRWKRGRFVFTKTPSGYDGKYSLYITSSVKLK